MIDYDSMAQFVNVQMQTNFKRASLQNHKKRDSLPYKQVGQKTVIMWFIRQTSLNSKPYFYENTWNLLVIGVSV